MNLSQFLESCRDAVDDPNKQKYPDALLVREADTQMRSIFREQVEGNKELHNFTMAVSASAGRRLFQNVVEYRLPSWILGVVDVYQRQASNAAPEDEFSPYNWSDENTLLEGRIPKGGQHTDGPSWTWEGHHTLRLWQYNEAKHLVLHVAKYPPRLFRALMQTAHTTNTKIILPGTLIYGAIDLERGAYVNAEIQVSGTSLPASTLYGEVRRVVDSNAAATFSGSRAHVFVLDSPLALIAGDTIESLMPIDEGHVRYLILRTLNAAFVRRSNLAGQRAVRAELEGERVAFSRFATPSRDTRTRFYQTRGQAAQRRDPDRFQYPF